MDLDPAVGRSAEAQRRRSGARRRAAARHRRGADAGVDGRRGARPHPRDRPRDVLEPQPPAYWTKGETSGHRQWVRRVSLDCDGDTILLQVDQEGPACHTGTRTCFDDGLVWEQDPADGLIADAPSGRSCWPASSAPASSPWPASKPWAAPDGAAGSTLVDKTGGHVPLAAALGLVALAGWGVLLVTRGRVRRAVAVLVAVVSAGVLVDRGAGSVLGARLGPHGHRRPGRDRLRCPRHGVVVGGAGRLARRPRGRRSRRPLVQARGPRWAAATTRRWLPATPPTWPRWTRATCGAPSTRGAIPRTRTPIRMRTPEPLRSVHV